MSLYKVSNEGVYLPFPGLTVIAAVRSNGYEFWKKINNMITECKNLSEYYAPLPNSSYHMTITHLYTQQYIGRKKWEQFIVSHTEDFKLLKDSLEQRAFNPEVIIESVDVDRTIKLVLDLPVEQKKIILEIARKHNLLKKIPHPFHITLAYRYKEIDEQLRLDFESVLKSNLSKLVKEYKAIYSLNQPKLCYFHDMNGFTPWNISEYPFKRI